MPHGWDKQAGQMAHGADKKDVDFLAFGLTIIRRNAYRIQAKLCLG